MNNPGDILGKNLVRDTCVLRGLAETEAEVPPGNARRLDIWFVPEEEKRATAPKFEDVLEQMVSEPAAIELWSGAVSEDAFHVTFAKRENFHQTLEQRDKRLRLRPMLWHLCARRPKKVIQAFGFVSTNMGGWYQHPDSGWRVQLVAVSELPKTRSTLLLRLLGRGRVRRDALCEWRSLPEDAWEKEVAHKWLVRVGLEVRVKKSMSASDREFVMDARDWYKEHMAKHAREVEARVLRDIEAQRAEERRQLEAQLAEAQRQVEVNQLVHQFEHRVGRRLNVDERDTLGDWVSKHGSTYLLDLVLDLSGPELAAWLEKNGVARSD